MSEHQHNEFAHFKELNFQQESCEVDISQYLIMKVDALINCSFSQITQLLTNPEKYKLFNPQLEKLEVLSVLESVKATIYYCSMKQYSSWYLPRDFVLINHSFSYRGALFIVEKSVNHSEAPKSYKNVLAEVYVRITMVEPKSENQVLVKDYFVVDYGGYGMTSSQWCQMALKERLLFLSGINNYVELHTESNPLNIEEIKLEKLRELLREILPVPDPSLGTD